MKGIPLEIDALLWKLAEEGSPVACAEFETRHKRYGTELSRRIKMVEELRAAGKPSVRRPAFTPRPIRSASTPRWAVGGVVALATLAVGAVAYLAASSGERPFQVVSHPPVSPGRPKRTEENPSLPRDDRRKPEAPPIPTTTPPSAPIPGYLTPRDVRIADTTLATAIELVARSGGLRATVAPGFEDRRVSLDYRGLNTIETLKAMGEEYGFSVLDEEEGHVLVVPVRENAPKIPRIGG